MLTLVAAADRVRSTTAIHPQPAILVATKQTIVEDRATWPDKEFSGRNSTIVDSSDVLQEALEILFTAECLILTEYVEIIVPVLYGIFIFTMTHLPSAQYHAEMVGVNHDNVANMVSTMFIYATLELLSFMLLAGIMKRNCGIDAFYLLAFVLQTQMPFVLSKLMLWMMFTLTFRVTHFGADLSFQFDWVAKDCNNLSCEN
ncbi:hypothetical protein L914_00537 [Phytophthora nicotianae]|uniref:Uncharacterized protein n=1 Tax=Phytophthora nicotianae TaxID=4792 RepID=W2P8D6_PHYNI|nr:hypothetical protein L914_00537 [Phytophthora nicotianae]